MNRSPLPLEAFEASAVELDKAVTLPPKPYTDPAFCEFEQRAIWDHSWMCVGRVDRIPNPGDYFTTTTTTLAARRRSSWSATPWARST